MKETSVGNKASWM